MRYPDKGFGRWGVFPFIIGGFEAKERTLPDLMNRGGWCPVALLVRGIYLAGFGMCGDEAFAKAMGIGFCGFAVGADVEQVVVVNTSGVGLNASFYHEKPFVTRKLFKAVGILPGFGGLSEMVGEIFVKICFEVVVVIMKADDAIAGQYQEFLFMGFDGKWFV